MDADKLTMPSLAAQLGVTTAALYRYFPSKQALADTLAHEVVTSMQLPSPEGVSWREWLRSLAIALHSVFVSTPPSPPRITSVISATGLRLIDTTIEVLQSSGFAPDEAFMAFSAVVGCSHYWAQVELADPFDTPRTETELLHHVRQMGGDLVHAEDIVKVIIDYDVRRRFSDTLDLMLDGIAVRAGDPSRGDRSADDAQRPRKSRPDRTEVDGGR